MKRNKNDVIAEIKAARDEARIKAHAYMNLTVKRYDYWRAVSAVMTYDEVLDMFEWGAEYRIPAMSTTAIADFERARDGDTTEMTLASADGRRDALASVAEWMSNR